MSSSERDFHPYPPFIPAHSTKLILGSIPPHRFCKDQNGKVFGNLHPQDVDFYYGSYQNHFWKILQEVFPIQFEFTLSDKAIQQRKDFLTSQKIAMFDVVKSCKRVNNRSSDKDLFEVEWMDIKSLLQTNPNIQTILCTSQFVRQALWKLLKPFSIIQKQNKVWEIQTHFGKLQVVQLYSPSPLLVRSLGKEGAQKRLKEYEMFLK